MYHLKPQMHYHDVGDSQCWDVKMPYESSPYFVGNSFRIQSAVYPPLEYWERNHHGGFEGHVKSGKFRDYPPIVFRFPPVVFTTHQMDDTIEGEWTLRIKQKRSDSRVRLTLTNREDFGFRFRIEAGHYHSINEVLQQANKSFVIEEDEHGLYRTKPADNIIEVPVTIVTYVERDIDFDTLLASTNQVTLERLGRWRPGKPDLSNVIPIDYFDRVETANIEPVDINLREMIEKLA